ncbi:hypothetical protein [Mucilaginibacter sp.]|jgi:hypothetical protein|uniref:hypothetical protein n=1 Tax=Mucilaginibacter sp. TaxID=1882438 RepID=UPI002624FCFF|nr:hypothetical protein [Mucilaginibacter sp.]MDB4926597.1 hypothetical protein [Mucilaginibacter sp.]
MKPLIFEFIESAHGPEVDFSAVGYDESLNLNVNLTTGKPAIETLAMSTVTRTKDYDEPSDSDKNDFDVMMVTETRTFTRTETSDSDANSLMLETGLITMTSTRQMIEGSDSDV